MDIVTGDNIMTRQLYNAFVGGKYHKMFIQTIVVVVIVETVMFIVLSALTFVGLVLIETAILTLIFTFVGVICGIIAYLSMKKIKAMLIFLVASILLLHASLIMLIQAFVPYIIRRFIMRRNNK